jgi:16S rRNA (adenine1518-N6/adenine1519-N6)-dimethyltransferase
MSTVHQLLRRYDLEPNKRLGQHFLVAEGVLNKIVASADLTPEDKVLEIGAGLGTLTRPLAEQAAQIVAVEIDRRLIPILEQELGGYANVTIIQGNILKMDPAALMEGQDYKVISNLPYGITSSVLRQLLEARPSPNRMVLTMQREVAQRILAQDGRMSLLAISVHFYAQPKLLLRIRPGAFYPPPEVESAVISLDRHKSRPVETYDVDTYFRVVRAGFSQPRKQLRNSLSAGLPLDRAAVSESLQRAGIDPRKRAERLHLKDWEQIVQALRQVGLETNEA